MQIFSESIPSSIPSSIIGFGSNITVPLKMLLNSLNDDMSQCD